MADERYALYGVIPTEREANTSAMTLAEQTIGDRGDVLIYETDDPVEARAIYEAGGFERNGVWPAFCANVAALPIDLASTFIRPSSGQSRAFGGMAALLTMLNSCAAGVCVVNIDAGFKAGYAAALIVRRIEKAKARG